MFFTIYFGVIIFVLGLLMGSFYNVCIYRIPEDMSIISPPSRCGNCNHRLMAIDLIPVLSWLLLGRKCRYCKSKISIRYPLVEILTGLVFLIVYIKFSMSLELLIFLILSSFLIIITFIDIDHRIIPDRFIVMGIILGVIYIFLPIMPYLMNGTLLKIPFNQIFQIFVLVTPIKSSIIGSVIGAGSLILIDLAGRLIFKKEGMGFGDVKLMLMMGLFLGASKTILALLIAIWIAGVFGVIKLRISKHKDDHYIPFGPFLALGSFISIIYGENLINWYVNFL